MKTKFLIQKLLVCLIAGLICGETFRRIGVKFLTFALPIPVVIGVSVAILMISLMYAFIWHRGEVKGSIDSVTVNAFWIGAIRYGIAFDLAMFAFQKIFHLQFNIPLGMLDEPFSSFENQWHVWGFFGHSYAFAVTIAVSQIAGSMMLLFNRTRLLGAVMLFPVMLNIILIDYFYDLNFPVLIHALLLFAGLIYLLMIDYNRLVEFFLRQKSDAASVHTPNVFLKYVGRLSILFIPLLLIAIHGPRDKYSHLTGKYSVTDMKINGRPIMAKTCSDSLLTLVYFDLGHDCIFEFNGQQRRMFGEFDWDESQGSIHTAWHYPPQAKEKGFTGTLRRERDGGFLLSGQIENDSMQVKLRKM